MLKSSFYFNNLYSSQKSYSNEYVITGILHHKRIILRAFNIRSKRIIIGAFKFENSFVSLIKRTIDQRQCTDIDFDVYHKKSTVAYLSSWYFLTFL